MEAGARSRGRCLLFPVSASSSEDPADHCLEEALPHTEKQSF